MLVDNDGKSSTGVARTDNEGNPVAGIDQVVAYKHNVKGEVTEMARDNDVNGKYDYREAYTLNANGGWIEKLVDLTNDNQFDRKEVYTKSASGAINKTEYYNIVSGGTEVLTTTNYYERNVNGHVVKLFQDKDGKSSTGTAHPINGIQVEGIDYKETYILDAKGYAIQVNKDLDAANGDERIEYRVLNPDGTVHKEYVNTDNTDTGLNLTLEDGRTATGLDEVHHNQYNANKHSIRYEVDILANGIGIDNFRVYERDQYGRVVKTEIDNDGLSSTPIDKIEYRYYDAQGRELKREDDVTINGKGIDAIHYNEAFDEHNRVIKWWYDSDNDGIRGNKADQTSDDIQYDEHNRVIFENVRWNWGGAPAVTTRYDEYGRATYSKVDYNRNGVVDNSDGEQYMYYENPNFIYNKTRVHSYKAGGVEDERYYDYTDRGSEIWELGDWGYNGDIDRIFFTDMHYKADLTKDLSPERLNQFNNGLDHIVLSKEHYITELTLDAAIISKIAEKGGHVRIEGDNRDMLHIKNLATDFTKLEGTFNEWGQEHYKYQTVVDGTTYTLMVETDINVLPA